MGFFSPKTARVPEASQAASPLKALAAGQRCNLVQPLTEDQIQKILNLVPELGPLELDGCLGAGGFSSVYRVQNRNTEQPLAVKITDPLYKVATDCLQNSTGRLTELQAREAQAQYRYFEKRAQYELQIATLVLSTECPNLMPTRFVYSLNVRTVLNLTYDRIIWLIGMPVQPCMADQFHPLCQGRLDEPLLLKLGSDLCSGLLILDGMGRHGALKARQNIAAPAGQIAPGGNPLPPAVQILLIQEEDPDAHLLHRDVKPRNIFLRIRQDKNGRILSVDFILGDYGITRMITPSDTTPTGIQADPFKAPELSIHPFRATPSSDLYSVAMVMFWALWGNCSTDNFERLLTLCKRVDPTLQDIASANECHPGQYFSVLAKCLYTVWRNALITPEAKTEILQNACMDVCSVSLLCDLLGMLNKIPSERPWQSAQAMRDALEQRRLAAPAQTILTHRQKQTLQQQAQKLQQQLARQKEQLIQREQELNREKESSAKMRRQIEGFFDLFSSTQQSEQLLQEENKRLFRKKQETEQQIQRLQQQLKEKDAEIAFALATKLPEKEETAANAQQDNWHTRWREQHKEFAEYKKKSAAEIKDIRTLLLSTLIFVTLLSAVPFTVLCLRFSRGEPVSLGILITLGLLASSGITCFALYKEKTSWPDIFRLFMGFPFYIIAAGIIIILVEVLDEISFYTYTKGWSYLLLLPIGLGVSALLFWLIPLFLK